MVRERRLGVCLIGSQKSGTTSLSAWLAAHPQLAHSRVKETHFWSRHQDAAMERTDAEVEAWFDDQFADAQDGQLLVDSSTSYSMHPEFPGVADRLWAHNPDLRILYIVRDPVARIESHLGHDYRNRLIDALDLATVRARPRYLERSSYHAQLTEWARLFPWSQIHVVVLEELLRSPAEELGAIEAFLGIDGGAAVLPRLNVTEALRGPTAIEKRLQRAIVRLPHRLTTAMRRRWGRVAPSVDLGPEAHAEIRRDLAADRAALEQHLPRPLPWPTA
jgi:hypothetical protein